MYVYSGRAENNNIYTTTSGVSPLPPFPFYRPRKCAGKKRQTNAEIAPGREMLSVREQDMFTSSSLPYEGKITGHRLLTLARGKENSETKF
jgi:hypothetical protein